MTRRRSNEKNGWVNFPVDSPLWKNTQEGGMFVKLVACEKLEDKNNQLNNQWGICCGVSVVDILREVFVGDDRSHASSEIDAVAGEEYHYPWINDPDQSYSSRDYLAAIIMGSTGWSGCSDMYQYWKCTYDDLTEEGKQLYNTIEKLYPNCDLHLLTFLDT